MSLTRTHDLNNGSINYTLAESMLGSNHSTGNCIEGFWQVRPTGNPDHIYISFSISPLLKKAKLGFLQNHTEAFGVVYINKEAITNAFQASLGGKEKPEDGEIKMLPKPLLVKAKKHLHDIIKIPTAQTQFNRVEIPIHPFSQDAQKFNYKNLCFVIGNKQYEQPRVSFTLDTPEEFLANQETIRVLLNFAGGFGDETATLNVMRRFWQMGFQGTFELVYPNLNKVSILFNLPENIPPYYEYKDAEKRKILFISRDEFTRRNDKNLISKVDLGITGAHAEEEYEWENYKPKLLFKNLAKFTNTKVFLRLNPWFFGKNISELYATDSIHHSDNSFSVRLDQRNKFIITPVAKLTEAKNYLEKNINNENLYLKKPALKTFITGMENRDFNVLPVYGYTVYASFPDAILQIIAGARYAQLNGPDQLHKPLIIPVFYDYKNEINQLKKFLSEDLHLDNKPQMESIRKTIQTLGLTDSTILSFVDIEDSKTVREIRALKNEQILLISMGPLPKEVFDGLYTHSDVNIWPPIREGANSMSSLLLTGRPHLRCMSPGRWELGFEGMTNSALRKRLEKFYNKEGFCTDDNWSKNNLHQQLGELIIEASEYHSPLSTYFQDLKSEITKPNNDRIRNGLNEAIGILSTSEDKEAVCSHGDELVLMHQTFQDEDALEDCTQAIIAYENQCSHDEPLEKSASPLIDKREDAVLENPDLASAISCLRTQNIAEIWRAYPHDDPEHIYVSFSIDRLLSTYGQDLLASNLYTTLQMTQIEEQAVIAKYKEILQREWIDRAGLPIKFLDNNVPPDIIKNYNVCFVVVSGIFNSDYPQALTLGMDSPFTSKNSAQYKIILLTKVTMSKLCAQDIYAFLHECGHAFSELKHPRLYLGENAKPPFCNFNCEQTIMVYGEHCPPVLNAAKDQVKHAYPTKLGLLDLAAACDFKKSWQERNRKQNKKILSTIQTEEFIVASNNDTENEDYLEMASSHSLHFLSESTEQESPSETNGGEGVKPYIFNTITGFFNSVVDYVGEVSYRYVCDVVRSCPATFPPHDVTCPYRQAALKQREEKRNLLLGLPTTKSKHENSFTQNKCLMFQPAVRNINPMPGTFRLSPGR